MIAKLEVVLGVPLPLEKNIDGLLGVRTLQLDGLIDDLQQLFPKVNVDEIQADCFDEKKHFLLSETAFIELFENK